KVWDIVNGRFLFQIKDEKAHFAVFTPDGKKILTWHGLFDFANDYNLKLWDADDGKLLFNLEGHKSAIDNVDFSNDGKKILTSSSDFTAKVWDVATGRLIMDLNKDSISSAIFSPDAKKILSITFPTSNCKIWNAVTGDLILTFPTPSKIISSRFISNGEKIEI